MTRKLEEFDLQDYGFEKSAYERPNLKWECGWACDGKACSLGPSPKGECGADFECTPTKRGSRWHCTRPKNAGGACEHGPLPNGTCCRPVEKCQPVPSIRSRRGMFAWAAFSLAFGLSLLALAGPWREEAMSAGELGAQHAALGDAGLGASCEDCHAANFSTPSALVVSAVAGGDPFAQNDLCVKCHPQIGDDPHRVHSLDPAALVKATERMKADDHAGRAPAVVALAGAMRSTPEDPEGRLQCAVCHHEHQGRDFDLKAMSDNRCQVCHVEPFADFESGHPSFTRIENDREIHYPYKRRARIAFDHVTHLQNHFKAETRDFDLTFEARVEGDRIVEGRLSGGAIDYPATGTRTESASGEGVVGTWDLTLETPAGPEKRTLSITPEQKPIVESESGSRDGEKLTFADGRLRFAINLPFNPPFRCIDCHTPDSGGATMVTRGFDAMCGSCHASQIAQAGTPVFSAPAVDADSMGDRLDELGWKGGASEDLAPFQRLMLSGQTPELDAALAVWDGIKYKDDLSDASEEQLDAVATVLRGVKDFYEDGLRGQTRLLRRIRKAVGRELTDLEARDLVSGLSPEIFRAADAHWINPPPKPPEAEKKEEPKSSAKGKDSKASSGSDDSILGDDDSGDILGGDDSGDILGGDDDSGDILGGDDSGGDILGGDADAEPLFGGLAEEGATEGDDEEEALEPIDRSAPVDDEAGTPLGGWYRKDISSEIFYRPSGHADAFLRRWIDVAGTAHPDASDESVAAKATRAVMESLTGRLSTGLCAKCHTVDAVEGVGLCANWEGARPNPLRRDFTRFTHRTHFALIGQQGCNTCHALDPESSVEKHVWHKPEGASDEVKLLDPKLFEPNFKPMDKAICAQCHTKSAAGDSCLTCHVYHVGRFEPALDRLSKPLIADAPEGAHPAE